MDVPGEKLLIKLWETIADKGIGSLLKPWQMRREGRAAIGVCREELLALAQAEVSTQIPQREEGRESVWRNWKGGRANWASKSV